MQTLPNPFYQGVVDLLMQVGADNYTIPQFEAEARRDGVSKRIAITSVPEGIVPGVSRLFLWHPQAIPLTSKGYLALVNSLVGDGLLDQDVYDNLTEEEESWCPSDYLLPDDFVPARVLEVTRALHNAPPKVRASYEEFFEINWQGGVFMYTILGNLEYVVRKGETDVPDDVARLGNIVKAVRVRYVNDKGEPVDVEGVEEEEA